MPLVKTNEKGPESVVLKDLKAGDLLRVHKDGDIYMHTGHGPTGVDPNDICIVHLRSGLKYFNPRTLPVYPLPKGTEVTLTQE